MSTPTKTDLGFADVAAEAEHVAAVRQANHLKELRINKLACQGIYARTPQPELDMRSRCAVCHEKFKNGQKVSIGATALGTGGQVLHLACVKSESAQPHRSIEDELRQDYPILYTDAIAALEMPSDERGILGQAAALALLAARLADKMEQKP